MVAWLSFIAIRFRRRGKLAGWLFAVVASSDQGGEGPGGGEIGYRQLLDDERWHKGDVPADQADEGDARQEIQDGVPGVDRSLDDEGEESDLQQIDEGCDTSSGPNPRATDHAATVPSERELYDIA